MKYSTSKKSLSTDIFEQPHFVICVCVCVKKKRVSDRTVEMMNFYIGLHKSISGKGYHIPVYMYTYFSVYSREQVFVLAKYVEEDCADLENKIHEPRVIDQLSHL